MHHNSILRSAGNCLSAALLLTVATSGVTFAAPPEVPPGLAKKDPAGVPPGQAKKNILQIEQFGARAFGGTRLPFANDPTDFLACDHGYTEWFIPAGQHKRPLVFTHGSGIRGYIMTFDGQPGFQSIFLGQNYPVYLVDLPWTGRAGMGCGQYLWDPPVASFSAHLVFNNRVGVWPPNTPESQKTFFPGVAFSHDPKVLDQYYRVQYPEFNAAHNEDIETDALAILLEEIYAEHNKKAVVFTHSSGNTRRLAHRPEDRQGRRYRRLRKLLDVPGGRGATAHSAGRRWDVPVHRSHRSLARIPQAHKVPHHGRVWRQYSPGC